MNISLMSIVLFLPTVGVLILMLIPTDKVFIDSPKNQVLKGVALLFAILTFVMSIPLLTGFGVATSSTVFDNIGSYWINPEIIKTSYHLKIDGISLLLVLLTTLLTPLILIASWHSIKFRVKEFVICMLLLETGMLGAFMAWDLLLFYLFWEIMLIPMYFIIGIWGAENKIYAAVKFFIYTLVGSLLMFLAILFIYIKIGNFDLNVIYANIDKLKVPFFGTDFNAQYVLFVAFALSFAIKVPMFPLHTWLPDAHVQAPTAGSVILAGVLLKMGTYGFIRFTLPIFPEATVYFAPLFSVLALMGIVYGALMALAQTDMKKLVAYSSISHLGFVMLGLFSFVAAGSTPGESTTYLSYRGVQGAIYQMIGHGLNTGALFLLIGMVYDRRHTKKMKDYGGIAKVMPIFAVFFMMATLASIGLPGLNGFVGEFLILLGTFEANMWYGAIAASGVVLGAVYMLILYQRVFFGECDNPENLSLKDLSSREIFVMAPITLLMIIMGVMPNFFLDKMGITLSNFLTVIPNIRWIQ